MFLDYNVTFSFSFLQAVGQLNDANEVLNERAVAVMTRMKNKLTGRDFSPAPSFGGSIANNSTIADRSGLGNDRDSESGLSVTVQVQKLIDQAMSHENLCQSYVGYVGIFYQVSLMHIIFPLAM